QTATGYVLRVIAQMQQRIDRFVRDQPNISAATAIAARWTTTRHELLSPKGRYAVATIPTLDSNLGAINKHLKRKRRLLLVSRRRIGTVSKVTALSGDRRWLGSQRRIDADVLSGPALVLEFHNAVNERKQGIVLAAADVLAWFPFG